VDQRGVAARQARLGGGFGFGLCFAPFPPVNLAGLLLTCLNFVLVRNNRLPKSEIPFLRMGVLAVLVYAALWAAVMLWLIHPGSFSTVAGWFSDGRLWLWDGFHRPASSTSPSIQRI
jgi:hypothetical protein